MNVSTAANAGDNCLNLNIVKGSKIYHYTDEILKPKKEIGLIEKYKGYIEKSLTLAEYKRKFNEVHKDHDITFYAYVLKVISSKNQVNGDQEVLKILVMT